VGSTEKLQVQLLLKDARQQKLIYQIIINPLRSTYESDCRSHRQPILAQNSPIKWTRRTKALFGCLK